MVFTASYSTFYILFQYLLIQQTPFVRRQVRKVHVISCCLVIQWKKTNLLDVILLKCWHIDVTQALACVCPRWLMFCFVFCFFLLLVAIVPLWLKRKLSTPKGPACPEVTHEDRQVQNVVVLTLHQSHKYPDCLIMPETSIHPSFLSFLLCYFWILLFYWRVIVSFWLGDCHTQL